MLAASFRFAMSETESLPLLTSVPSTVSAAFFPNDSRPEIVFLPAGWVVTVPP